MTRLLLIEDNLPDRIRYRRMLQQAPESYDLLEAATAAQGLELVTGGVDGVLLDNDLPDEPGLSVLDRIRSAPEPPVVVMLTGEEDAAVSIEALKLGAADYLMKRRIDEDSLHRAVRGALERGRLEREVRDQQRRLALFYRLASQTDDALFIIDSVEGRVTECNHSARAWLGVWPFEEGAPPAIPSAFETFEQWQTFLREAATEGSARFEWRVTAPDGTQAVCEILARRVDEQGVPYVVAVGRDITSRVESERDLRDQTQRDALTGILNRRAFDLDLERLWATAARTTTPLAMLMIDVDHFKSYNDTLGHPQGDECLRRVARVLADLGDHAGCHVYRYGGEEFAALVPVTETNAARNLAEDLRRGVEGLALEHPDSTTSNRVTVSVGAASRVPGADEPAAELVHAADDAVYRAKFDGRNRVVTALPF